MIGKKILANDGMDPAGRSILENNGFLVDTKHINQDDLYKHLNEYEAITVRSATEITKELIDAAPNLKLIGRGGVGMDNIDVAYARSKGIKVVNTPAASSMSVAELVFSHLFSGARYLYDAQRKMPIEGSSHFSQLKRSYASGIELRGKTLGIVGFGRIGQEVGKMGLGLGMNVIVSDLLEVPPTIPVVFANGYTVELPVEKKGLEELFMESDFISLHVPFTEKPILGKNEFAYLKRGVGVVNTSRGAVIDEEALIEALDAGILSFAGLDVFNNEPYPSAALLSHPKISLSPHIGAATNEAQLRVGTELATLIVEYFCSESQLNFK